VFDATSAPLTHPRADKRNLDAMSSGFERVQLAMRGTLTNLNKMLNTGGSKHMCYLGKLLGGIRRALTRAVMFVVCVFLVLYWFMKG